LNRTLLPLILVGGLVSAAAVAQDKTASNSGPSAVSDDGLAVVEITGSLIRSSEKTQFNSVQTITPEDIQATGSVTVADYLHDLAVNSASSWGDNFAYGATGGAGIAMRGLSEKYTLVLVDGQRVAPYGFPLSVCEVSWTGFQDSWNGARMSGPGLRNLAPRRSPTP
jgi:iron complex outermembrane receptor protein